MERPAPRRPREGEAEVTDSALLARHRAGDPEAFGELVRRYQGWVRGLARRLARDPEEAADLGQVVFLRAFSAAAGFRQEAAVATWLFRIAVNLAHKGWRGRRLRGPAGRGDPPPTANGEGTPLEHLEARDAMQRLVAALGRLPAPQRRAVLLRELGRRSYAEIARELAVGVGTVKSRVARAREKLRRNLGSTLAEPALLTPGKNGTCRERKTPAPPKWGGGPSQRRS